MKRKSVALIAILSMMLSITACGSKADDTSKESTKESQVVVESSNEEKTETHETTESEAVVETTGAVETTASTESTETEAPVETDSRLDVEIIGECVYEKYGETSVATVFSVTNVSGALLYLDTTSAQPMDGSFCTYGVSDFYFEDGETLYAWVGYYTETPTADKINEALSERCNDGDENVTPDVVVTKETFAIDKTEDMQNFIDSICSDGTGRPYLMICYQGEKVVGITDYVEIENIPFDADKVEICCMKFVNRQ